MELEKLKKLSENKKILYVEDDLVIRDEISSLLSNFFDCIHKASNGQEALKIYNQYRIDIVITDLKMPIMGGIELTKRLKEINPSQHIIVISAHSEIEYLVELIDLGINSFLIKPISLNNLLNTLYNILYTLDTQERLYNMKMTLLKEKTTNELLHNIIHHWTQPVTALGLQIFTLQSVFEEQDKKRFEEIYCDMNRTIRSLSDNLSIFQKIYNFSDDKLIKISEIIDNLNLVVMPSLNSAKISLNIELIDDVECVYKDFLDILLVFIDNSKDAIIKTNPINPYINIKIYLEDNNLHIVLEDNGGGISNKDIDKIFDLYYSSKFEKNFTGVGLFFAKSIIEKKYLGKIEFIKNDENTTISKFIIAIPNKI